MPGLQTLVIIALLFAAACPLSTNGRRTPDERRVPVDDGEIVSRLKSQVGLTGNVQGLVYRQTPLLPQEVLHRRGQEFHGDKVGIALLAYFVDHHNVGMGGNGSSQAGSGILALGHRAPLDDVRVAKNDAKKSSEWNPTDYQETTDSRGIGQTA